jgi:DNA-directed RNA polymerase subunit RPC12/RpoP
MNDKKKVKEPEEMVLYVCPYCGSTNLKSLVEIRNRDTWVCPYCDFVMQIK